MTKQPAAVLLALLLLFTATQPAFAAAPSGVYVTHDPPAGYEHLYDEGNSSVYCQFGPGGREAWDMRKSIDITYTRADNAWRERLLNGTGAVAGQDLTYRFDERFQLQGRPGLYRDNSDSSTLSRDYYLLYGNWLVNVSVRSGDSFDGDMQELHGDALALLGAVREADYFARSTTGAYVAYDRPAGYAATGDEDGVPSPDGYYANLARYGPDGTYEDSHYITIYWEYADEVWARAVASGDPVLYEEITGEALTGEEYRAQFTTVNGYPAIYVEWYWEGRMDSVGYFVLMEEWMVTVYAGISGSDEHTRQAVRDLNGTVLPSLRLEPR